MPSSYSLKPASLSETSRRMFFSENKQEKPYFSTICELSFSKISGQTVSREGTELGTIQFFLFELCIVPNATQGLCLDFRVLNPGF